MSNDSQPSLAGRFFRGTWRLLNGTRVLILNLVFFGLLFLILSTAFTPDESLRLESGTTFVLRPEGNVVEEYSSTPFDRALQEAMEQGRAETRLRDLVTSIGRASRDPRISQMLIDTDYLWGIGLTSLLELEEAIQAFKSSGKPVVAMGTGMGQHQYYLAAQADEVWLAPGASVWIDGYANVRQFFREGLEKLAVEINLFRVGEYKSAMEPFVRDDMSPEAKEASLHWLGGLWQTYLDGVTRLRGIPPQVLGEALRNMPERLEASGGDFAAFAIEEGLADQVISRPQARQELALRGAPNRSGDGYRAISALDYLVLTNPPPALPRRDDIKILVAEGEIVRGRAGPGTISADEVSDQLRKIGRMEEVQAVVLRVNSPGGDAVASEQIRRELQSLQDAGITVVVSMGDVAASGGYWLAMSADEIWAAPSTITGSIGVFGLIPTFSGTLDKIGIHTDGVGTTELAGKLRVDRPLDPQVARIFQASTEHVYRDFIEKVAEFRGQSVEAIDAVARGRVWSGAQALDHGLVDQLGGLQDAVDAAARIAGLGSDFRVGYYQPVLSAFDTFLADLAGETVARLPLGMSSPALVKSGFLAELVGGLSLLAANNEQFTVAAHCMCRIR